MQPKGIDAIVASIPADETSVIGICGLPGSGKTTLASRLAQIFHGRACIINVDDFCIVPTDVRRRFLAAALSAGDQKRLAYLSNPERPEDNPYANPVTWYDWSAAADVVKRLRNGESVERLHAWNQKTGKCDKSVVYRPPHGSPNLYFVDCIYLFEEPLANEIDYRIMIDIDAAEASRREFTRDSHRSDRTYLEYKQLVSRTYCVPYLQKHRSEMNFLVADFA